MAMDSYQKLRKHFINLGKRSRYVGGKPEACICAAEKKLGVRFPPDYRQFLADFGAGKFMDFEIFGLLEPADKKKDCARQYSVGRGNGGENYKPKPGEPFEYLDTVEITLRLRKAGLRPGLVVFKTQGYGGLFCLVAEPGNEFYGAVAGQDRPESPAPAKARRKSKSSELELTYSIVRTNSMKPKTFAEFFLKYF